MAEMVPEILEKIEGQFQSKAAFDPEIHTFMKKLDAKEASLEDAHNYTERLGELISVALQDNLTGEKLPDGKLHWDIAEGTIRPMMEKVYDQSNEAAARVQKIMDEEDGIGLNAVMPEFPEERVRGLMNKAVAAQSGEELQGWLGEPVVNTTQSFFDNFVKENAEFRKKAGMSPKIVRKIGRSERRKARTGQKYEIPCAFCKSLAGEYDYKNAPQNVYVRHRGCRCVVTYQNGKSRQNVWTKEVWQADEEELEKRRQIGLKEPKTAEERLKTLPKGENVTAEYIRNATPGVGEYVIPQDRKMKNREEENMKLLYDNYGGDIKALTEIIEPGRKNPDYLWNGKFWEEQEPTKGTKNAVDKNIQEAIHQIRKKPGGIVLDVGSSTMDLQEIEEIATKRLNRSAGFECDVIVIRNGGVDGIFRHKK